MTEEYDYLFKVLILGDSGVGKSCMLLRFTENNFSINHVATIGVDFKFRIISLKNSSIKLQIWDTAGQERFKTLAKTYYNGAMGIVITYDSSDLKSFENVKSWLETIRLQANENIALILVGNKADADNKQVSHEQGKQLADELGIKFFSISAKTGQGVKEAFEGLAEEIFDRKIYEFIGNAANKRLNARQGKKKNCCR